MERILLVSADSHVVPPPGAVSEYIEERYKIWVKEYLEEVAEFETELSFLKFTPETLQLMDKQDLIRSGGDLGWEMDRRLREMDREGVAAEMLLPLNLAAPAPFFDATNHSYPDDVQQAGARLYHRWASDFMAQSQGRIFGVALPGTCLDMGETVKELRWVADHGFSSVSVPGRVANEALPPLYSEYYEPFWAACAEVGLGLNVHAGHGRAQGELMGFISRLRSFVGEGATDEQLQMAFKAGEFEESPFAPTLVPQQIMWEIMLGGVFDRYPGLTLTFTEVRADWVPATLQYLDSVFDKSDTPLTRRPSEYWQQHCMAGVSSIKRSEVRLRHQIGLDQMMFGRDYPHREGTWPNTWDWLRDALFGVPEDEARLLLGENAVRCYGLDRDALWKIANRIGPKAEEILGSREPVDASLVENFNQRSGYAKSFEEVNIAELAEVVGTGLAGA